MVGGRETGEIVRSFATSLLDREPVACAEMNLSALEGETFGPYPIRVCKEKVDEFLGATDGDNSRWSAAAPPGYLAVALFVVAPELLARLDGYSVIHGEQTFAWRQPLRMEQDLEVSGTVTRVRERGGSFFVNFEMKVTEGESEVAGGSSLFLVSASGTAGEGTSVGPDVEVHDRGNPSPDQRAASRADLVKYAAATRDWNPIHWDHDAALAAGLSGVVVHGLLQAAWALDAAAVDIDDDRPFESAKIRFRNPLVPASPVTVTSQGADHQVSVEISNADKQFLTAQVVLSGE